MEKIKKAPVYFESENDMKNFVLACEADFESRLDDTISKIEALNDLKIIALSGPTCAGKTTAAKKIISEFEMIGKKVNVISIDDFYYDREVLHQKAAQKEDVEIDYDSPDTIDLEAISRFVESIERKEELFCPIFDFNHGERVGYKRMFCGEGDVFVFEGIQAVYPEITALFNNHAYCSVFISPRSAIEIEDHIILPNELRLLRRLVRDRIFRSTSAEFTFKIWDSVRKNEEEHIFPYADACMFNIDSSFAYEISVLKPYLYATLEDIPQRSGYISKAKEILDNVSLVPSISSEFLPNDSLYWEFVR